MIKKYLKAPYAFAEDTVNYPAGALPWSGQPKLITLSDSTLNTGFTPDTPIDAPTQNALGKYCADAITIQNHAALTKWGHYTLPGSASLGRLIVPIPAVNGAGSALLRSKMIIVAGVNSTPHAIVTASNDGKGYEVAVTDTGFDPLACLASDDTGTLFGGVSGIATAKRSTNRGVVWTSFTPGNTQPIESAYFDGTHYIVAGSGEISWGPFLTTGWTATSFGAVGDHARQIVGNRVAGSNATILVMSHGVVATAHSRVMRSTDHGNTWTVGHDFGVTTIRVIFSEAWNLFVAVEASGALWTSPDGLIWTKQKTAALIDGIQPFGLASIGYAIVAIVNHVSGSAVDNTIGIAYTFDLGANWFESYFGDNSGAGLQFIMAANGRLYASDDRHMYISGAIESPATLYTGV